LLCPRKKQIKVAGGMVSSCSRWKGVKYMDTWRKLGESDTVEEYRCTMKDGRPNY